MIFKSPPKITIFALIQLRGCAAAHLIRVPSWAPYDSLILERYQESRPPWDKMRLVYRSFPDACPTIEAIFAPSMRKYYVAMHIFKVKIEALGSI